MNVCHQILESMIDTGTLSPEQQAHLETCADCRKALAGLSAVRRLTTVFPEPLPSESVSSVIRAIKSHKSQSGLKENANPDLLSASLRLMEWSSKTVLAVALSIFLLVAGMIWLGEGTREASPIPQAGDFLLAVNSQPPQTQRFGSDLEISAGQKAVVSLPEKIVTEARGPSRIAVKEKSVDVTSGELFFQATGKHSGFEVRTPHGTLLDLSATFEIHVTPEKTTVRVMEGALEVLSAGERKRLRASEVLEMADVPLQPVSSATADAAQSPTQE